MAGVLRGYYFWCLYWLLIAWFSFFNCLLGFASLLRVLDFIVRVGGCVIGFLFVRLPLF